MIQPKFLPEEFCLIGKEGTDFVYPPVDSADNTIATLNQGFPYLQEVKPTEGGVVVQRQEFNGLLKWLSNISSFQNKGGMFTFNDSNTLGYPLGAILWYDLRKQFVRSLKDNNKDNFLINPAYIDAQSWEYVTATSNNFAGDMKYSFQKTNHIAGNGEWLIANGQVIPTKYTQATSIFGTNLPALLGRTLAMAGNGHNSKDSFGADTITLTELQMPVHTHIATGGNHLHAIPQSAHEHGFNPTVDDFGSHSGNATVSYNASQRRLASAGTIVGNNANIGANTNLSGNLTITNSNAGSSGAHSNIQPTYYVENIFIYCC